MIQSIVTTTIIKPTQSRYVLIPQGLNVLIAIRSSIRLIKQLSFIKSKFTSISQEVDETIRFSWTPPLILHKHVFPLIAYPLYYIPWGRLSDHMHQTLLQVDLLALFYLKALRTKRDGNGVS